MVSNDEHSASSNLDCSNNSKAVIDATNNSWPHPTEAAQIRNQGSVETTSRGSFTRKAATKTTEGIVVASLSMTVPESRDNMDYRIRRKVSRRLDVMNNTVQALQRRQQLLIASNNIMTESNEKMQVRLDRLEARIQSLYGHLLKVRS
jgi:hypothetical protein